MPRTQPDRSRNLDHGASPIARYLKRLFATVQTIGGVDGQAVFVYDDAGNQITTFGGGGGGGGDASEATLLDVETNTAATAVATASIATDVAALLTEADFDTKVGGLTEAAPATDTASSGLNGRLQRIAQRLTTLIASVAGLATETTLGACETLLTSIDALLGSIDGEIAGLKSAKSVTAIQLTASGDTDVLASGTRKILRVEASNSHASTAVTVGLKIPSLNGGAVFGKKYLPAAGGLAVWVFPHGYLQCTAEKLIGNLSAAGQIELTAYYE